MNGSAAPASASAGPSPKTDGTAKGSERVTSVPPGTVRSPSVVKHDTTGNNGKPVSQQGSRQVHTQSEKSTATPAQQSAPHPGTAGKAAASAKRTASTERNTVRTGIAGNGVNAVKDSGERTRIQTGSAGNAPIASWENPPRHAGTQSQAGIAGTTSSHSGIQKAPRTAQSHTSQNTVQSARQSNGTSAAESVKSASSTSKQTSELRSARFTQRPSGATGGGVREAVPADTAKGPSTGSGATPSYNGASAAAASRQNTAAQETRAPRSSDAGANAARKAPGTAAQESRPVRSSAALSDSGKKPLSPASAAQENRLSRSNRARPESIRKVPSPVPAQQKSRPDTRSKSAEKHTGPRIGSAGIAPPAARTAHDDQSERPPHQEVVSDTETSSEDTLKNISDREKEGDASE